MTPDRGVQGPGLWASVPLALRGWTGRQWLAAALASLGIGMLIGLSTVLVPNRWFGREIATVAWNYPVWIAISLLSGMLTATYVRPGGVTPEVLTDTPAVDPRPSRIGAVGAILGWFAVGCPVCNKLAIVALGYSGALRWFAPAQPVLAVAAIALSAVALAVRLRGQLWCPTPTPAATRS